MREMLPPLRHCGNGLDKEVALVTDSRFSGYEVSRPHISPEPPAKHCIRPGGHYFHQYPEYRLDLLVPKRC